MLRNADARKIKPSSRVLDPWLRLFPALIPSCFWGLELLLSNQPPTITNHNQLTLSHLIPSPSVSPFLLFIRHVVLFSIAINACVRPFFVFKGPKSAESIERAYVGLPRRNSRRCDLGDKTEGSILNCRPSAKEEV
jgi:hypothetical protein